MIPVDCVPGSTVGDGLAWSLEDFEVWLDRWIAQEAPDEDLRLVVTAWVLSRFDDPYAGVRREHGFDNLWFGQVPFSVHNGHQVVVCSYWIFESRRVLRCNSIATLNLPL
jgi:hypothetical protein